MFLQQKKVVRFIKMATNQGNSNSSHPNQEGPTQGNQNQDYQELRAEVNEMKIQVNEIMRMLQALTNGGTTAGNPQAQEPIRRDSTLPPPGPVETVTAPPPPGSRVNPLASGRTALYEVFQFNENNQPQGHLFENPQVKDQYQLLEERIRAIEDSKIRAKNAYDLCLVPDVVIPPKFKVPEFDKYDGMTCPKSHLTMYCRKMAAFTRDDNLLIHYFQDSLTGASLNWYMQLEPSHIHCWKDLADAFIRQYQYNSDLAPDRTQLQSMIKKDSETFKEYAQRWRAFAAQVSPPLLEKELVSLFLETLPPLYYDKLIGSASSNFSGMVTIGERIETGIQRGKISCKPTGTYNDNGFPTKKNGEANAIISQGKSPKYDPIPMSYTDLCSYLISHNLISPREMKPVQPPFPKRYNPKATCEFHSGAIGHSAENCYLLKHLVQGLIDTKRLTFTEDGACQIRNS